MKSQWERMLAGEPYSIFDLELVAARQRAKDLLWIHNRTEAPSERKALLQSLLGHLGQHSIIEPPFFCTYGLNTYLGDHVYLNVLCTVIDNNEVRIGNHVMMGPAVQIYTAEHPLQAQARNEGWEVAKRIVIEENVWIGGSAVLLPGVTVGRNAVVGAGAVVTRDVPPNTVVAGSPAKVIRRIDQ